MYKQIDNINRDFFWNKSKDKEGNCKYVPTIVWDKICRWKCEGGLGIRKAEDTSATFLPKQG